MSRSAPQISFSVTSINYGTIDVNDSSSVMPYNIYGSHQSTSHTDAINMSISFKGKTNASEAKDESWVWVSTLAGAAAGTHIGSVSTGPEEEAGTVRAGTRSGAMSGISLHVRTKTVVPSGAATAGAVQFYLHHRILAVIRRGCGNISTLVTTTIKALNQIAGLQLSLAPFPL